MPTPNSEETLAGHWCPPAAGPPDGGGAPVACLASTFEFDAAFFEADLLPRFLGLRFDHTEDEPTFLIEREEALASAGAAVLVDVHKVDPGQTTLRWDQVPVAVPGPRSVQHSKVVVLVWERLARLVVGSANLTRTGYRRNREVFAALDFWDGAGSLPLAPLRDALDHLEQLLAWARVPDATRRRTRGTLNGVRARVGRWAGAPGDFRPRELPRVGFVATCPASGNRPARSTLDEALRAWGHRRATDVTVFTPFAGEPAGAGDKVVERLADVPRRPGCTAWLVVPRSPAEAGDASVRVPLAATFGGAWRQAFGARGEVRVLAVPRHVPRVDRAQRAFHSKLLSLEDDDRHLLLVGSSNFTPHGMGVGVFNAEANLLFEDAPEGMWEGIELPVPWDAAVPADRVVWEADPEPAEDTADGEVAVPRFFAWASYSPATGVLRVGLDRAAAEPPSWAVSLGTGGGDRPALFRGPAGPGPDELSYTFPPEGRPANPTTLAVGWTDEAGAECQARLPVSAESMADLLPPDAIRALGIDAVFDCLTRGLGLAEWHARRAATPAAGTTGHAGADSLRSVDTSRYVLYRTRQFGRAVHGLCERLERTPLTPAAVAYRLFTDPLGPVALAGAITAPAHAAGGTPAADDEHRLFLAAELLLAVGHVTREMVRRADPPTKKWLRAEVARAVGDLTARVNACRERLGSGPPNLETYVTRVLDRVATLHGPPAAGVSDAG